MGMSLRNLIVNIRTREGQALVAEAVLFAITLVLMLWLFKTGIRQGNFERLGLALWVAC